jgi:hypothetical protein
VVNLRLDQSWGFAAISGAIQDDRGAYYNNAINSSNANFANTVVQGHPGDTFGYAGSIGFVLTDFLGMKGDTLTAQVNAGHGAAAYVTRPIGTFFQSGGNSRVAYGVSIDGVYANGTQMFLSDAWAAFAAYEHFWTPKVHTSWYGGMTAYTFSQDAKRT